MALNAYFKSQSVLEIHRKLQKLAMHPNTDSAQLVEVAFRVQLWRCDGGRERKRGSRKVSCLLAVVLQVA